MLLKTSVLFLESKLSSAGEELKLTGSFHHSPPRVQHPQHGDVPSVCDPSPFPRHLLDPPAELKEHKGPCSGLFLHMHRVQAAANKVASRVEGEQDTPCPLSLAGS